MIVHQAKVSVGIMGGAGFKTYVVIPPHAEDHDWNEDGITAYGGAQCMAIAAISEMRCRKTAIVAMMYLDARGRSMPFGVCGGHFAVHRDGNELRIDDT